MSNMAMKGTEEQDKEDKGLIIFGRDVSKIPCFRSSLLYGIGGGLCFGLGRFMITSHVLRMKAVLEQRALLEGTSEAEIIEAELGTKPVDI